MRADLTVVDLRIAKRSSSEAGPGESHVAPAAEGRGRRPHRLQHGPRQQPGQGQERQQPDGGQGPALIGPRGAQFIAAGIAFSAFGFLAQSMLTAPRVYFAMAEDRVFFSGVAWVHPKSRVPVVAIALQGVWAIAIALTGTYAQVVNYVVAMDCIFFALTAACLFVMRRSGGDVPFRVPGHPWTTLLFIAAECLVVISTFAHDPVRSFIGLGIAAAGLPAYWFWSSRRGART